MDDAVHDALAETVDGFVLAYYVIAEHVGEDGRRRVTWQTPEDQSDITTIGLITYAQELTKYMICEDVEE